MMPDDIVMISEKSLDAIHFCLITVESATRKAYNAEDIDEMREAILEIYRNIDEAIQYCYNIEYFDTDFEEED